MRLAFAVFYYFPYGGMQRNMLAIAKACLARGHEVTVYLEGREGEWPKEVPLVELPAKGLSHYTKDKDFVATLQAHLVKNPVDLLVGFNRMPGLDIYYAGDSCFATKAFEDRSWLYRMTGRSRTLLAYEKAVFEATSKTNILLVSALEREAFERYYKTQEPRFHVLPPGISTRCIAPDNAEQIRQDTRAELNIADGEILLLALGSGFKTKGLDRSIILLAEMVEERDARLVVVGQDKPNRYIKLAKQKGVSDKVHFLGGRDDVPAILQAADILLHPAYRENTGNVLLEAMVAGLPVIASDACGYAHYVREAELGEVIKSPFTFAQYKASVMKVLSVSRGDWRKRGKHFAETADIYSRPERAADIIENIAMKREAV